MSFRLLAPGVDISLAKGLPGTVRAAGLVAMGNGIVVRVGYLVSGVETDVVVQSVETSTGTPVVVSKARYPMRPLEGDSPTVTRMTARRLDDTRVLIYWRGSNGRLWLQVVQVWTKGMSIRFGTPVAVAPAGGVVSTANGVAGSTYTQVTDTQDSLAVLNDGSASLTGVLRSGSVDSFAGIRVTTDVLVVQPGSWHLLNDGSSNRTVYVAGSVAKGPTSTFLVVQDEVTGSGGVVTNATYAATITWGASPAISKIQVSMDPPYPHVERDSLKAYFFDWEAVYAQALEFQPTFVPSQEKQLPDLFMAAETGVGYDVGPGTTPAGGFLAVQRDPWVLVEVRYGRDGFVRSSSTPAPVIAPAGMEHRKVAAIVESGNAVVLVDYQRTLSPFDYVDFMYVFSLTGDIGMSGSIFSQPHFLQVRTG